ncbi:hypothetical protein J7E85_10980 [Paenibacillus sp. ISL-20]|nr:hypothetical protein [Paenibacillus sp. ISL-20]
MDSLIFVYSPWLWYDPISYGLVVPSARYVRFTSARRLASASHPAAAGSKKARHLFIKETTG